MSALDLSSLLTLNAPAPEMHAPAEEPAIPEIDTSATSTSDSNSASTSTSTSTSGDDAGDHAGGDIGDAVDQTQLGLSSSPASQHQIQAGLLGSKLNTWMYPYASADEEAAAALVDLSGASSYTVDEYEVSVPPNLAAASALLDELTSANSVSTAAVGSLYTLMSSSATLALTAP